MPDQPQQRPALRADVPTLEPDDLLLARLSALAAAGSPGEAAAAPRATWRIGLAAASVAAVLLGAAWLAGLGQSDGPDPAPAPTTPATRPAVPEPTETQIPSDGPQPGPATTPGAADPAQPSRQPTPR